MRIHSLLIASAITTVFGLPAMAQQQGQSGTAEEAKAMLVKAVAAVKADRDVALAMFNKGEGGFRVGDLYPYCARISDAKAVATPLYVPVGTDIRTLKDANGKEYGKEQLVAAQKPEGTTTEITYMAPKPGTTGPAFAKVAYIARAGDLVCGVGYYK
jgi:hypothetical protein